MSATEWVTLDTNHSGYARVVIAREPVNSMNLELWERLYDILLQCEKSPDIRGIIFTSGLKKPVFTAGNDLKELYPPATSRQRYTQFWTLSNTFLSALYESPLVTVSAINGACPAGGCCISLACDYRVMAEDHTIGLNEVALGIPVPYYWAQLMARTIPNAVAERLCLFAQMVPAKKALAIGLVDEVVPMLQVGQAAEKAIMPMLKLPDKSRAMTKKQSRSTFCDAWRAQLVDEAEMAFTMLQSEETMAVLGGTMERLSGKRSKM